MIRLYTLKQQQICLLVGLMPKAIEVRQRFSLEKAFIILEKGFMIAKTHEINKGENMNFLFPQALIWTQKWVAPV